MSIRARSLQTAPRGSRTTLIVARPAAAATTGPPTSTSAAARSVRCATAPASVAASGGAGCSGVAGSRVRGRAVSGGGSRSVTARVVGLVALVTLASSLLVGVALVRTQSEANVERASDTLALQADNLAARLAAGRPLAAGPLLGRLTRQGVAVDVARPGAAPPAPFTRTTSPRPGRGASRSGAHRARSRGSSPRARVGDGRTVLLGRRLAQAGGLTSGSRRRAVLVVLGVLLSASSGESPWRRAITRPLRRVVGGRAAADGGGAGRRGSALAARGRSRRSERRWTGWRSG